MRRQIEWGLTGLIVLVLTVTVGLPMWADAAGPTPTLTLSPSSGSADTVVTASGSHFAHSTVQLTWDGSAAGMPLITVSGNGSFSATFTVPPSTAGTHEVQAAAVSVSVNGASLGRSNGNKKNATGSVTSAHFLVATVVAATPVATATPAPTVAPTATQQPTASPSPSASVSCPGLQTLIDAAGAGSTLTVAACLYREQVTIAKTLTLVAEPGAEIRGSDVWTSWSGNVSILTVPSFPTNGNCVQPRCGWPEQVFIDGVAQTQLAMGSSPLVGQFALDAARHVVLGSSPAGHLVEVTTRQHWITIQASDVTVSGFRMQHAATPAQDGALRVVSGDRATISQNVLSDAHGNVVLINYGSFHRLLNNEVFRGGQKGIHSYRASDTLVQGNSIHENNTEGFDALWDAGGLKAATATRLTMNANTVYGNDGPGLWCDMGCTGAVFSNNRIYDNAQWGIFFEISNGAAIFGNVLWDNARTLAAGWGSDILVSDSANAEVYNNVSRATDNNGLLVTSTSRADRPAVGVVGNYIHDNTIIMSGLGTGRVGLGWLQNWAGIMFDAASNNRGVHNAYWFSYPEPSYCRFAWNGCVGSLASFNATPGEEGGHYITTTERDQILAAAGIPSLPQLP